MSISLSRNTILLLNVVFSSSLSISAIAQTYSPYTPEQIQEFNNQPLSPVETPGGPIYLEPPPVSQGSKVPFDARYFQNPEGEEQAEAQGSQSAAPFEPIPATIAF